MSAGQDFSSARRRVLAHLPALPALLLGTSGCGGTAFTEEGAVPGLRLSASIDLGEAYAGSSINAASFREQSIIALTGGGHAVGYFDARGDACLAVLAADGVLRRTIRVDPPLTARLLADGHCGINLGRTEAGVVVVMYGAHGNAAVALAVDEGLLQNGPLPARLAGALWPPLITYPQFYQLGGRLQLWYRSDPDNTVQSIECDDGIGNATGAPRALLVADGDVRPYMNQLAVNGQTVALSWMYRVPSTDGLVHNEGLYLALSDDGGRHWRRRSGEALALPITRAALQPEIDVPSLSRWPLNQTASCFAPDGNLLISLHARDAAGVPQIHLVRCATTGTGQPQTEVVSDNTNRFELDGAGSLWLPLSRPQLAASADQIHVIYRQGERLVIASRRHLNPAGAWVRRIVTTAALGAWEPSVCRETWARRGILLVYVQPVRQGPADTEAAGPPTSAQVLVFENLTNPPQ